jgi:hypothetical protein
MVVAHTFDSAVNIVDVAESSRMREILLQHLSAKWVYLHLPNCLNSCPFKAEIKPANSGEQTSMREWLCEHRNLRPRTRICDFQQHIGMAWLIEWAPAS